MENTKVLYYLKSNENVFLIEIKNLLFKKNSDKSKYLSWFKIENNVVEKLTFEKMNDSERIFEEGTLILNNEPYYIDKTSKKKYLLVYSEVNIDLIKKCLEFWENS